MIEILDVCLSLKRDRERGAGGEATDLDRGVLEDALDVRLVAVGHAEVARQDVGDLGLLPSGRQYNAVRLADHPGAQSLINRTWGG